MMIGTFKRLENGGYDGSIDTIELSGQVQLRPVIDKKTEKSPDLDVFYITNEKNTRRVKIGSAWNKASEETGNIYQWVVLSDPSLSRDITAMLVEIDGEHQLLHKRRDN